MSHLLDLYMGNSENDEKYPEFFNGPLNHVCHSRSWLFLLVDYGHYHCL